MNSPSLSSAIHATQPKRDSAAAAPLLVAVASEVEGPIRGVGVVSTRELAAEEANKDTIITTIVEVVVVALVAAEDSDGKTMINPNAIVMHL